MIYSAEVTFVILGAYRAGYLYEQLIFKMIWQ
ncbi:hypothetical protein HMPREF9140_01928 [Prevotella micans F0438]|uniref:Uncharacterized protein n=1 Tax=Prevotella micans F0438 TaxID=883158 RepID=H1Q4U0_9BACT|nr:hypothetical protein HMPREF9140_01928 [Prevotella micans F0438]